MTRKGGEMVAELFATRFRFAAIPLILAGGIFYPVQLGWFDSKSCDQLSDFGG